VELSDIQQQARKQLGIEIEPNMCAYVQQQTNAADAPRQVPLIGADARTGVPMRLLAPTDVFTALQS
jgi:hypothetical protein